VAEGWKYSLDGKEHGPVPLDELLRLLREGAIGLRTSVMGNHAASWTPLSAVEPIRDQVLTVLRSRGEKVSECPTPPAAAAPSPAGNVVPLERPQPSVVCYAGLARRLAAGLLDAAILGGALFLAALAFQSWFGFTDVQGILVAPTACAGAAAVLIICFYGAIMESGAQQATLGKIVLDVRVTDLKGSRMSFGRAFARSFAKLICPLTFGTGFMLALFTARRQALHDLIARSLVILTPAA